MGWDPTDAMSMTYVVASTNVPSTTIPASPSVCCQGTSTSRQSEEGSSTPGSFTPAAASRDGGSSRMFTVLATSTVPGRDVVIEYVRMAVLATSTAPGRDVVIFVVLCSLFLLRKISPSSGCLPLSFRVPWLLFHMEHTFLSSPPASSLPSPSRNQCRAERRNKTAI